ncbi:RagB/SusD family nutrient uptake outer membrane protein [Reichenbachiella sp. MALMAid0571]|uniref:RagB/SusD family nutrient uptake outer membrane protein n=1 Tax=Reichenbachiella sp. MALMAid0571 TaxID=3143939 RepID=UPI0032E03565
MKLYRKIINSMLIIGVLSTSCTDELDQSPITEKDASNFFSTEVEIESAIMGVYASLQAGGLYGLDLIAAGEVSSDITFEEVPTNDDGRFGQLDNFTTFPGNSVVANIWQHSYVTIQRANLVLNRIDDISFNDSDVKNHRIGETRFVRALMYFNLVRLYGDVPLVTRETIDPTSYFGQGRTAKSEVYTQIESDLTSAISLLPDVNGAGRPGKGTAQALLGKVYLTLGQYGNAATELQKVVDSGNYSLVADVNSIFGIANENNSEVLFAVEFKEELNGNSEGSNAFSQFSPAGATANAKGHNIPTMDFYESYNASDLRKSAYFKETGTGVPYTNKWSVNSGNSNDGGSDFIVIRYSDVVLMLAEALNETDATGAIDLLNSIRNRAGLSNTTAVSKSEIREAIASERKFELINEGQRWFDLVRANMAISIMNAYFASIGMNITIGEDNLLLPVPQSQIDADPALKQNPGY